MVKKNREFHDNERENIRKHRGWVGTLCMGHNVYVMTNDLICIWYIIIPHT